MSRIALLLGITLVAVFSLTSTSFAAETSFFGRMFPNAPQYTAPPDAQLNDLAALNGPLFDPNADAQTNPNETSFFTYFGQFLDHDTTLDRVPSAALVNQIEPSTIPNNRDPRMNLDSVYGGGPDEDPQLYEADGKHFKLSANGRDLPRNPDGSAILVEPRNDENQIIAQIHVAFLRHHNALIDQGYSFQKARELTTWQYQWIVVHEFLPGVLDSATDQDVFQPDGAHLRYYNPANNAGKVMMPAEFSVVAYRFGHSMVRKAYILTKGSTTKVQVFNTTGDDLRGGRPISANHIISWDNFLPFDGQPPNPNINRPRNTDTLLSSGLFVLPIPGAEANGPSILALRNMQRARSYGLPSGQELARDTGNTPLSNQQIVSAIPRLSGLLDPAYQNQAPPWLYVLAESEIQENGLKLGPTGSRIVAEVFAGVLQQDEHSYVRHDWTPPSGTYRAQDFLTDAGVAP